MSGSLRLLVISDLLLTVSCQCLYRTGQLRQLRPVQRSLSADATTSIVQELVSSHLDYCNSLLYSISDGLLQRVVSTERRCTSGHGRSKGQPRDAHNVPVTLAAGERQRIEYKSTSL